MSVMSAGTEAMVGPTRYPEIQLENPILVPLLFCSFGKDLVFFPICMNSSRNVLFNVSEFKWWSSMKAVLWVSHQSSVINHYSLSFIIHHLLFISISITSTPTSLLERPVTLKIRSVDSLAMRTVCSIGEPLIPCNTPTQGESANRLPRITKVIIFDELSFTTCHVTELNKLNL